VPAIAGPKFALVDLLSTSDGGKTFQIVTPPDAAESQFSPPERFIVNERVVRMPDRRSRFPAFARQGNRPLAMLSQIPLPSSVPGEPMTLKGTGFLLQNTVWFRDRAVPAVSSDGENLPFLILRDLLLGSCAIFVENAHGKTHAAEVIIGREKLCNPEP
jgi:hypothetical protein